MLGRGQGRAYPWGDRYDGARLNHGKIEQPNFDDSDGFLTTSPAGSFPSGATPDGVLDGFGNAWEWVADLRFEDPSHHEDGRTHPPGLYAAVRGGSYFFDLERFPAGERNGFLTEIRRKTSGFRCARDDG
jgi:formylglycine-generating enzyme required for sulfatase activity